MKMSENKPYTWSRHQPLQNEAGQRIPRGTNPRKKKELRNYFIFLRYQEEINTSVRKTGYEIEVGP